MPTQHRNRAALLTLFLCLAISQANAQFTTIINVPSEVAPPSIGSDTQLNLLPSGTINNSLEAGTADGTSINVEVNISGGSINNSLTAYAGSTVNMAGGYVETVHGFASSNINFSSGVIEYQLESSDGMVNITGGSTGEHFRSDFRDSFINLSGGILNGPMVLERSQIDISGGSIDDNLHGIASQFIVSDGTIGNDSILLEDSTLKMSGGSIGDRTTINGTIDSSGGSLGNELRVIGHYTNHSRLVNISGGTFGNDLQISNDWGPVNTSGGIFGDNASINEGRVNISGGTFGDNFGIKGSANISGGTIGENFIENSSNIDLALYGTQFVLDGVDITNTLVTNEPLRIDDRDVTLNGLLADGSTFSFDLVGAFSALTTSAAVPGANHIGEPLNSLHLTLVEPGDFDINFEDAPHSLDVDGSDFLKWQRGLADYQAPSDLNNWQANFGHLSDFDADDDTDGQDFLAWQRGLSTPYDTNNLLDWQANFGTAPSPAFAAAVIPEPSTALLLLIALVLSATHPLRARLSR